MALVRYEPVLSSLSKIELTLFSVSVVFILYEEVTLFEISSEVFVVCPKSAFALARYEPWFSSLSKIELKLFSLLFK